MNKGEVIKKIEEFRTGVRAYSDLLLSSRDSIMPDIVRNFDLIDEAKSKLLKIYAGLEKYIKKFGNNPKMNDGVWNVMYSPYDNAFTSDILIRVGRSIDSVIDDLNLVLGRLEAISEEEFEEKINPHKKEIVPEKGQPQKETKIIEKEVVHKETIIKNNKWNYCNPFWLIWKISQLAWKHKIISGIFLLIIIPLLVAYIQHRLGWNQ